MRNLKVLPFSHFDWRTGTALNRVLNDRIRLTSERSVNWFISEEEEEAV
jgi:hypothetical protein